MGLVKRIIEKILPSGNDEVLKFLEERNSDFLRRIKGYGLKNIKEYEAYNADYFRYRHSSNYKILRSDC